MLSNLIIEVRPPLLGTKLSVPRLAGEFLHRTRLIERIDQGVKGPRFVFGFTSSKMWSTSYR